MKNYQINHIKPNQNSGIFFEHLGSAKLYADNFKLVTYMNISFYDRKLELIKNFHKKTKSLCQNHTVFHIDIVSCHKTTEFLNIEIPSIEQKQINLYSLLSHKRNKRGIFNGGGTFFKWMLGVADNDDLERINDAIDHVEKDDDGILKLMQEQIHVIRTTIGNFNESISTLKIHEETLNANIAQLNDFFVKDKIFKQKNDVSIKLLSYLNAVTYLVNELNEQLDVLMDAILFAKSNVIHPRIISPTQFVSELDSQTKSLQNGKAFPLPLEPYYAFKLLDISTISCSYSNERLIFIIETPICESTLFNIYRSLPLPIIIPKTDSYIYIEPSFPFILLSDNKMQYKQIKDLKECIKVTGEDFLCESHTSYSTLETPSCESALLTSISKHIPDSCQTTKLRGNIYIWHELKFNQWLYVMTEPDRLTIICDQTTYDEPVNGTGILTLTEKCIGYSKLNKLSPSYIITSEYVNIIPSIPLAIDDCCDEKNNNSEPTLHLNQIHMSNIRLDELRYTTHQLNKFEKDLHHLRSQHHHYSKKTNYFYLGLQIIIAIIASVILFRILKFFGCFVLLSALCKCFNFNKSCCNHSGCCVAIYNQCSNATRESTPIRTQPQPHSLTPMRFNDLRRAESQSLYDEPSIIMDQVPRRKPTPESRRPQTRRSYHGYSIED